MGARNAKARLGKPGHHGAHEQECDQFSGLGGPASRVPVALILRAAELTGEGILAIDTLVDARGATAAEVQVAIAAVEDRIGGARRRPHPLQVLAAFESALPSWKPGKGLQA